MKETTWYPFGTYMSVASLVHNSRITHAMTSKKAQISNEK